MLQCCLCGVPIRNSRGNNARPVGPGRCCNECNHSVVEPHRLNLPGDTEEEHFEWLAGVETFLDDTVLMLAHLVSFIIAERGRGEVPDWVRFREQHLDEYTEQAERVFAMGSVWSWSRLRDLVGDVDPLPHIEGMLAAFRLAHGLVARGEDEDIAKNNFPDWGP